MVFQQAPIQVQRAEQFDRLKSVVRGVFLGPDACERFCRMVSSRNVRIRDWEKILQLRIFEQVNPELVRSAICAQDLYRELAVSDQALMREFYLEEIERVDPRIRSKFQKIYRDY